MSVPTGTIVDQSRGSVPVGTISNQSRGSDVAIGSRAPSMAAYVPMSGTIDRNSFDPDCQRVYDTAMMTHTSKMNLQSTISSITLKLDQGNNSRVSECKDMLTYPQLLHSQIAANEQILNHGVDFACYSIFTGGVVEHRPFPGRMALTNNRLIIMAAARGGSKKIEKVGNPKKDWWKRIFPNNSSLRGFYKVTSSLNDTSMFVSHSLDNCKMVEYVVSVGDTSESNVRPVENSCFGCFSCCFGKTWVEANQFFYSSNQREVTIGIDHPIYKLQVLKILIPQHVPLSSVNSFVAQVNNALGQYAMRK